MPLLIQRKSDGTELRLELATKPLVIGRGLEADVRVEDDEVSRSHCAIWMDTERGLIKDLRSRNGTFVNDERITERELQPRDRIRIGHCEFVYEPEPPAGFKTMIRQVQQEMDGGKGFSTILREVVKEIPKQQKPK